MPSHRTLAVVPVALVGFAALAAFAPARALAAEQEWRVGAKAGVGILSGKGVGPAVGVDAVYGLGDMFDLRTELYGSRHDGSDGTDVWSASVGLAYKIDVFRWVPYAALLGGYYYYGGALGPDGEHGSVAGASAELGLDYLVTREFGIGADVRWHASFDDGLNFPLFSAMVGVDYRWGF